MQTLYDEVKAKFGDREFIPGPEFDDFADKASIEGEIYFGQLLEFRNIKHRYDIKLFETEQEAKDYSYESKNKLACRLEVFRYGSEEVEYVKPFYYILMYEVTESQKYLVDYLVDKYPLLNYEINMLANPNQELWAFILLEGYVLSVIKEDPIENLLKLIPSIVDPSEKDFPHLVSKKYNLDLEFCLNIQKSVYKK